MFKENEVKIMNVLEEASKLTVALLLTKILNALNLPLFLLHRSRFLLLLKNFTIYITKSVRMVNSELFELFFTTNSL